MKEYIIEFRSGTFFQNLQDDFGGPKETAKKFSSIGEAENFMDNHPWIYFNGGMIVCLTHHKNNNATRI